jgi:hypothetical protein
MGQWDQKYGADAQRRQELNGVSHSKLQDLYCNMTGVWFDCRESGKFVEGTVPPNRPQDPGVKQDMITEIIRQEHLREEWKDDPANPNNW